MKKAIAYLRVSTDKQGVRGLGIEAQREAVAAFSKQRGYNVLKEYVEAESGRKCARPELAKARAFARATKATLIVAKLDRLSRDADMVRTIISGKEDVAFCDFPQVPEGPVGKFMLSMLGLIAEFESDLISQRTKAAMAAAKARGQTFGNAEGLKRYWASRSVPRGNPAIATRAHMAKARARFQDFLPHIREAQADGATTLSAIAERLNEKGIPTPKGETWYKATVQRALRAAEVPPR